MATEHVDVVVVGSGFGGSVATYRLADAGLRVVLLERGRAYPPGSFPRTQHEMTRSFWNPASDRFGMFNVWSFDGIEALVSAGLGGGSLIYANVLLRKPPEWFVAQEAYGGVEERWPIRGPRAALRPRRADAGRAAVPLRRGALQRGPEDAGAQGSGRAPRPRLDAPPPRRHLRQRRRGAGARRAHPGAVPEPPRAHPLHVPALRRVRRLLQLREQELPRLQLPLGRAACRRRRPHALRGAHVRAPPRRRVHRPLRPPR